MGETVTYKGLAEVVGNAKAMRAVGGAMRSNPVSENHLFGTSLLSHLNLQWNIVELCTKKWPKASHKKILIHAFINQINRIHKKMS